MTDAPAFADFLINENRRAAANAVPWRVSIFRKKEPAEKFTRKFCKTNVHQQLFPIVTLLFLFQYQAFTEEFPSWHIPCKTRHAATVSQTENPVLRAICNFPHWKIVAHRI